MRLKLFAIVVLLVGGGAAVAWSTGLISPSQAAATTYLTAAATVRDVSSDIAATGTVQATQSWNLQFGSAAQVATSSSSSSSSNASSGSSSVTWPVTAVKVAVGQAVKKGDVLATASTTDLDAQITSARRQRSSAKYQLDIAQANRDNASGATAIQNADIQLLQAQGSYATAAASYVAIAAEKAYASLVAPADGVVTAVNVVADQDAPSGVAISVASNSLEVTTSVVESDVPLITVGQDASVTLTAVNATLQGSVASIAPTGSSSGSNGSVSFAVTILLEDVPSGVRPGMSASITITTAAATNVLAVPSRALTGTAGSYAVRILNADGTVTTQPVQVGLVTSTFAEIKSGLQAGQEVITGTSAQQAATTNNRGFGGGLGGGNLGGGFRPGNGGTVVTNP